LTFCGNWQPAHSSHRIGTSVDIDRSAELTAQSGHYLSIADDPQKLRKLIAIFRKHFGIRIPEETLHFEFRRAQ